MKCDFSHMLSYLLLVYLRYMLEHVTQLVRSNTGVDLEPKIYDFMVKLSRSYCPHIHDLGMRLIEGIMHYLIRQLE